MKSFLVVAKFVEKVTGLGIAFFLITLVSLAMCIPVNEMGKGPLSGWLVKHSSNLYS